jgi:hypothetical protein
VPVLVPRPVENRPGFYPQPNDWTCGPFALKHALAAIGKMVDAREIKEIARSHWWAGTNEIQLARAARTFETDLKLDRRRDAEQARKVLIKYLREQVPVLLCVDEWTHWITVVRYEDRRFVIIDSEDDPVLNVVTWSQLRARWRYHDVDYDKDDPPILYDLLAVVPRTRTTVKADFHIERVKFLRRPENHALALHWDEYVEDLLEICRPPSTRASDPLSMGEFLRRHQELLVSRIIYWHGDIERDAILRILRNFRFVSETYDLVIPVSATRRAVADLAILVTMWAVALRGLDEMYGLGKTLEAEPRAVPRTSDSGSRNGARNGARSSRNGVISTAAAARIRGRRPTRRARA